MVRYLPVVLGLLSAVTVILLSLRTTDAQQLLPGDFPNTLRYTDIEGDTVVASAPTENGNRGAVYVFEKTGNQWTRVQKLTLDGGLEDDEFGSSIVLSQGELLVGAKNGSGYSYRRSSTGRFEEVQVIAGARHLLSVDGHLMLTSDPVDVRDPPPGSSWIRVFKKASRNAPWILEADVTGFGAESGNFVSSDDRAFAHSGGGLVRSYPHAYKINVSDWTIGEKIANNAVAFGAGEGFYAVSDLHFSGGFRIGTTGAPSDELYSAPSRRRGAYAGEQFTVTKRLVFNSFFPPFAVVPDPFQLRVVTGHAKRHVGGVTMWEQFDRIVLDGLHDVYAIDQSAGLDGNRLASPTVEGVMLYELDPPFLGRLYVDADAAAGGDGQSWDTAMPSLQDALDQVAANPEQVDQIWVAQGIYRPDSGTSQSAGDATATFNLPSDCALIGGFQGGETEIDQRDPDTFRTILSGDIGSDDDDSDGNGITEDPAQIIETNSYHVVTASAGNRYSIVDGFVITAGDATAGGTASGGGILTSGGGFTLRNSQLHGNRATEDGGAIYAYQSSIQILDSAITGNEAGDDGGASYFWDSRVAIERCRIAGNSAGDRAGGFYITNTNTKLITCEITGNVAANEGGALHIKGSSRALASACTFSGNYAGNAGGAIFSEIVSGADPPNISLSNTLAWNNATSGGSSAASASINLADTDIATTLEGISHCLIENENPTGFGDGNLDGTSAANDPQFTAPLVPSTTKSLAGDFSLSVGSPALDAGDNGRNFSELDVAGKNRPRDSNHDGASIVDIGADELHGEEQTYMEGFANLDPLADDNDNGVGNLLEFSVGGSPTISGLHPALLSLVWGNEPSFIPLSEAPPLRLRIPRRDIPSVEVAVEVADNLDGPWLPFENVFTPDLHYSVESRTVSGEIETTTYLFDPYPITLAPGVPLEQKFFRLRVDHAP